MPSFCAQTPSARASESWFAILPLFSSQHFPSSQTLGAVGMADNLPSWSSTHLPPSKGHLLLGIHPPLRIAGSLMSLYSLIKLLANPLTISLSDLSLHSVPLSIKLSHESCDPLELLPWIWQRLHFLMVHSVSPALFPCSPLLLKIPKTIKV